MSENLKKFKSVLSQIFEMDKPDLDFGIYRIINQKRKAIQEFMDKDLVALVGKVIREAGKHTEKEQADFEDRVFSDLACFFARYYDGGDFISQRRYKDGVYAIPYNGEEVKLHWANADQYYIKSGENFRNYRVDLGNGKKLVFFLNEAEEEQDNKKAQVSRYFMLAGKDAVTVEDNEFRVTFVYKASPTKTDQSKQNEASFAAIKKTIEKSHTDWAAELLKAAPTEANPHRTLLEKHLATFSARNSFDYFIHKDLGGFLTRELDFFLKNEVLHLDDLDTKGEVDPKTVLAPLRAIKRVGQRIIALLAQLEDFQKRMWLKKKFVLSTDYLITLDRIPEELYSDIIKELPNGQQEEWVKLFDVDKITSDLTNPGYSKKLSASFLTANSKLPIDTSNFSAVFKSKAISCFYGFDSLKNGLLLSSDNFHGINLLRNRYLNKIRCVYIDPPYNTGTSDFIYKDSFKHSSWLSMMESRISSSKVLLKENSNYVISIDDNEYGRLKNLMDDIFGDDSFVADVAYERSGSSGLGQGGKIVSTKEHVLLYSYSLSLLNDVYYEREIDFEIFKRYNKVLVSAGDREKIDSFIAPSTKEPVEIFRHSDYIIDTISLRDYSIRRNDILQQYVQKFDQIYRLTSVQKENDFQNKILSICKKGLYSADYTVSRGRQAGEKVTMFYQDGQIFVWLKDSATRQSSTITKKNKITDHWSHAEIPKADLANEGGVTLSRGKKPEQLLKRILEWCSDDQEMTLDFFGGTGTTAAVSAKLNRKFISIEQEEYFRSKLLLRIKNLLHGDQTGISKAVNWNGSGLITYNFLESYEDVLNNLVLPKQEQSLDFKDIEDRHLLRYLLDVDTNSPSSLLAVDRFREPFSMTIKVMREGRLVDSPVDLVETFNYLIGLTVDRYHLPVALSCTWGNDGDRLVVSGATQTMPVWQNDGCMAPGQTVFRAVTGILPDGKRCLVVWRTLHGKGERALQEQDAALRHYLAEILDAFDGKKSDPDKLGYDTVYINGDCSLKGVSLLEDEFLTRMFTVEDV